MVGRKKANTLITPLELEIMQVLWETGPANVQTVQESLKTGPPLAYTTVQTMLNVLHRKGKVKRKLRGRAFEYAPTVTREKITNHAVREMIERLFSGSAEGLLMNLVKTRQINAKKIAELSARIDRETKAAKRETRSE